MSTFSIRSFADIIEEALQNISFPAKDAPALFAPVKYTLESGGKRIRPILVLATFEALSGKNPAEAVPQALGIELFHNFTLLHDDVMDHAELRRGRPTVHKRWNTNVAILSGDAMLTLANMYMTDCDSTRLPQIMRCFNETAIKVYEGQQLDMEFETRSDVSVSQYIKMIELKTSVLLAGACMIGAIMANASQKQAEAMYDYGLNLGLAFQLRDDWLDTYGDPAIFGKCIGGDILNRKKTWLLTTAISEARDETLSIISEDLEDDILIEQVTDLYNRLDIPARCLRQIDNYSAAAVKALEKVEMNPEAMEFFKNLALEASSRSR
ncbi:MAG: polyprenyl synthetase family protein [Muribaculaceae bacterium]|nr:polyprenyl synthetase family protein [Muribaculaceae bacterium]